MLFSEQWTVFTTSACNIYTDENQDGDDAHVDRERGQGPVLGVEAVLVLPNQTKTQDHVEGIDGVAVLHLESNELFESKKPG